jgi:hypothetical protein
VQRRRRVRSGSTTLMDACRLESRLRNFPVLGDPDRGPVFLWAKPTYHEAFPSASSAADS